MVLYAGEITVNNIVPYAIYSESFQKNNLFKCYNRGKCLLQLRDVISPDW